jgi:hypothetical protein
VANGNAPVPLAPGLSSPESGLPKGHEWNRLDRRLLKWARIAVPLLLLTALWPRLSQSAANAAGLDLAIVIDQSGSMSGADGARAANDPTGKRVEFLHRLASKLADEARKGYTTRLSVVEFGARDASDPEKRPQVTLDGFTVFPIGPGRDRSRVEQEWDAALRQIQAVSRGDTDHPRALALAEEQLRNFANNPPAAPLGGKTGERLRAAILITDGKPYVERFSEAALLTEIRTVAAKLRQGAASARFGVVGLGDDSDNRYWYTACGGGCGRFWKNLASRARDGIGMAYLAKTDRDLIGLLDRVFNDLIGREGVCGEDPQTVPPYLSGMQVQVEFYRPGLPLSTLDIRDPLGQRAAPGPGDLPTAKGVTFRVSHPAPGLWRLASHSQDDYRVCLDYELEQAHLITPASPAALNKAVTIRYRLEGRGANGEFQEQDGFPLRFTLAIQGPNGIRSTLDMVPDSSKPGEIVATTPYLFQEPGEYRLHLRGDYFGIGSAGNPFAVYQSQEPDGDSVRVDTGAPIRVRVETPAPGATVPLFFGQGTLAVRLSFVNEQDGSLVPPGEALKPGEPLNVQWLSEHELTENPSASAETPRFIATQQAGDKLAAELPIRLGVAAWNYIFRPGALRLYIQPTDFKKGMNALGVEDGDAWRSAPYPFRESRWTLCLGLLLVFMALAWSAWRVWRSDGARRIRLQDRALKFNPRLLLQFQDRPEFNQEWKILSGPLTRPMPAKTPLPDGTDWNIEDFLITRRFARGAVCVMVRYRPRPDAESDRRPPIENVELESSSDELLRSGARRLVKGLREEAYFVLQVGKDREGAWQ